MSVQHTPPSTYILRNLNDVTVPESVSWWPQTIGWKIFACLLVLVIAYAAFRFIKHWWMNRYRSEAIRYVESLDINDSEMPRLTLHAIKTVLTYLNSSYANLYGPELLNKVDELHQDSVFSSKIGELWLETLVNPHVSMKNEERIELKQMAITWLHKHQEVRNA